MQIKNEIVLNNKRKLQIYDLQYGQQRIKVSTYGARLLEWIVPCAKAANNQLNLVLNHADLNKYVADDSYMGAVIGPIPNRLQDAEFYLDGVKHSLAANEGTNSLHSSNYAFSELDFTLLDRGDNYLLFACAIEDGQGHTLGKQNLQAKFTLHNRDNQYSLQFEYRFTAEQNTVCNICNHSYFRLWDNAILDKYHLSNKEAISKLELTMPSEFYTPTDENLLVTGEVKQVKDDPLFDFRKTKTLQAGLKALENSKVRGYDHNFILQRDYTSFCEKNGQYWSKRTSFSFPKAALQLEFKTTEPAAQLYTANYLASDTTSSGEKYGEQSAFCFECQAIPNSLHFNHLSTLELPAGKKYVSLTEITFKEME